MVLLFLIIAAMPDTKGQDPVRIGIAGLSHSHVIPLLRATDRSDIKIVGIAEENTSLAKRYIRTFSLDSTIVYESLEEMLDKTSPEGVVTFTSIFDHLKVVKACAPRGIHVMVEKPLAVNVSHAKKMAKITDKYGILLITNYETTWYPSTRKVFEFYEAGLLGDLRKIIVYDGHMGPKEIKVNNEFLEWLTDPVLNGGGAVTDFGCYGADLITWIMEGEKPENVMAVLKTYKPGIYSGVDDDATILLTYPGSEGIIHASWNWPFNRKDMHVYGSSGYVLCDDGNNIRYRLQDDDHENHQIISPDILEYSDPFSYFGDAIRGKFKIHDNDLSALPLNITVVSILDAAKKSSKTGRQVRVR